MAVLCAPKPQWSYHRRRYQLHPEPHQHRKGTFGMLRRHTVLGSHRRPRHLRPAGNLPLAVRARRDWLTYSRRLRMQARHERWDRAADRVVEAGIAGLVLIVALAGAGVLVIHGGTP